MNRLTRVTAIVIQLQSKKVVTALEKAMKNEDLISIFSTIDEKEMIFQHFKIFNSIN
ncbi:MAG: hypothetical protein ACQETL_09630 [Bacteroidota bacterium]